MDKNIEKALLPLSDRNTYFILKSNPTRKTQRVLNAKLLLLRKSNTISKATYENLYSSDGLSPLRPIVSFVNSPTYEVSSFFGENIVPCGGKYRKHSKKFLSFCKKL
jgi:hypothetical protein